MNRDGFALALRLMGLGGYIAASIVLGILGGLWLDGRLGTGRLFTVLGIFLGIAVAFYGVYRMVAPLMKADNDDGNNR